MHIWPKMSVWQFQWNSIYTTVFSRLVFLGRAISTHKKKPIDIWAIIRRIRQLYYRDRDISRLLPLFAMTFSIYTISISRNLCVHNSHDIWSSRWLAGGGGGGDGGVSSVRSHSWMIHIVSQSAYADMVYMYLTITKSCLQLKNKNKMKTQLKRSIRSGRFIRFESKNKGSSKSRTHRSATVTAIKTYLHHQTTKKYIQKRSFSNQCFTSRLI